MIPRSRSLILVVAVAAPLVTIIPGAFPVTDDGSNSLWLHRVELERPAFLDQLEAAVLEAVHPGHYRPTQDAIITAAWNLGGVTGWTRLVLALYLCLHVASVVLLAEILQSLGAGTGAWLAAIAFGLHPVASAVFVSAQYAHNVPGVCFTLLACRLVSHGSRWMFRAVLAAVSVFLAAGSNPNWLISAPVAVTLCALIRPDRSRRVGTEWLALAAIIGGGLLAAATLRLYAAGTLTTPHPGYAGPRSIPPLSLQLPQVAAGAYGLQPAVSPALERFDAFRLDPERPSLWMAVFLGGLAPLLILLPRQLSRLPHRSSWRALAFSIGWAVITLAPYVALVGYGGQHRYLYAALAGLTATAVLSLEWVLDRMVGLPRSRWLLPLLLAPGLVLVARAHLDSVASIRVAHRHSRIILNGLAVQIREDPTIKQAHVLGRVISVGRSGRTLSQAQLQGQLAAMVQRPGFTVTLPSALEIIARGGVSGLSFFQVLPPETLRRIRPGDDLDYEALCLDFLAPWRILRDRDDHPIATIPSARLGRAFVEVLSQRMGPREVAHAYRGRLELRHDDPRPASLGVGMLVPSTLAKAIRAVIGIPEATDIICRWIESSAGAPRIVSAAVLATQHASRPDALRILSRASVVRAEARERIQRQLADRFTDVDPALFSRAVVAEAEARRLFSSCETGSAHDALELAELAYDRLRIPCPELQRCKLRIELALGRTPPPTTIPLAEEIPCATGPRRGLSGLHMELVRPIEGAATDDGLEFVLCITNLSSHHVPGGHAPDAARLRWERIDDARPSARTIGDRRLPDHGIPAGGQIRLPGVMAASSLAGASILRAILELGDESVICELPLPAR